MSPEMTVDEFNQLVEKAAEIHPLTWCVKRQAVMPTSVLRGSECCRCEEFVCRGGVCDPL